jgi:hypothetical protein
MNLRGKAENGKRKAETMPNRANLARMSDLACVLWGLLLGTFIGCATSTDANVRELHLFGVPVAVNLDQTPGPDGFAVRVYASNGRAASGIPIRTGRLELALYDGAKPNGVPESQPPLRVWTYDGAALKAHAGKSSIGWGYRFAPAWGDAKPTRDRITVVVRYVSPSGEMISSSPSVISMTSQ